MNKIFNSFYYMNIDKHTHTDSKDFLSGIINTVIKEILFNISGLILSYDSHTILPSKLNEKETYQVVKRH